MSEVTATAEDKRVYTKVTVKCCLLGGR